MKGIIVIINLLVLERRSIIVTASFVRLTIPSCIILSHNSVLSCTFRFYCQYVRTENFMLISQLWEAGYRSKVIVWRPHDDQTAYLHKFFTLRKFKQVCIKLQQVAFTLYHFGYFISVFYYLFSAFSHSFNTRISNFQYLRVDTYIHIHIFQYTLHVMVINQD